MKGGIGVCEGQVGRGSVEERVWGQKNAKLSKGDSDTSLSRAHTQPVCIQRSAKSDAFTGPLGVSYV